MKNQQLIRRLASDLDAAEVTPVGPRLAAMTASASLLSLAAILLLLARSPHLVHGPTITILFVVSTGVTLSAVAFFAAVRLSSPEGEASLRWLLLPVAILVAGIGLELADAPRNTWITRFWGSSPLACFVLVIALSLPILLAALYALRGGATTHPYLSGAMAGLVAGGIAASLYALHCPEDSLLFVGFWHGLAIVVVTAFGALAAGRYLHW